jgi:hypothetical protein
VLEVDLLARLWLGSRRKADIDIHSKSEVVRERVAAENLKERALSLRVDVWLHLGVSQRGSNKERGDSGGSHIGKGSGAVEGA